LASKAKRTTFAKLNREAAVRERKQLKQAKRRARKDEPAPGGPPIGYNDPEPELEADVEVTPLGGVPSAR